MKKLKVFHSTRMTTEFKDPESIVAMTDEINLKMGNWIKKEKISNYEIVNSHLSNTAEFTLYGQYHPSIMILSIHISFED